MQKDDHLEKMKTQNPNNSPKQSGDGFAVFVVILLLFAIAASSPRTNKKQNQPATNDSVTAIDTIPQKSTPDTAKIEHYATPFDSIFFNIIKNPKQK